MLADIEGEQTAFERHMPVDARTDFRAFQRDVIVNVNRGRERMADVQLMFQMFFCRHVDNFQIFLEELVRDIASAQQELLEHVKVKNAGKYSSDELRERRLQQISRMSLRELRQLLDQSIHFQLFTSHDSSPAVDRLYDVRNLITHNNGIVDFMFAQRYPNEKPVGHLIELDTPFIKAAFNTLIDASGDIQLRAQERFRLWQS